MSEGNKEMAGDPLDSVSIIEADSVVVEIVDKSTGQTYRRNLPAKYCETENGIVLTGETLDGTPSQIAFLSESALVKIKELFGKGPDVPRCKHE